MSKQYIRIERSLLLHGNEFALGLDAMLLYAMLRDRCTLSARNGLHDADGRIYVYCSRESAAEMVGCSVRKAVTLFRALADAGLLREVATGGAKRIYVKQWTEPSVLHTAESLRDGGFFNITIDRVHVMPENYITIDIAMLASNISNRAKVLYALLSDASSKQRLYGRDVCSLPRETAMPLLQCGRDTLRKTYAELEEAGLISRSGRQGYGGQRAVSITADSGPICPSSTTVGDNLQVQWADNCTTVGDNLQVQWADNCTQTNLRDPSLISHPCLTSNCPPAHAGGQNALEKEHTDNVLLQDDTLRKEPVLHADEMTLQVLKEPGRSSTSKSYMWLYRTSGCAQQAVVLYEYQPTKKVDHAEVFLQGFSGWCTQMGTRDATSYPRIFERLSAGPMHSEDLMRHCKRCPRRCKRTHRQ